MSFSPGKGMVVSTDRYASQTGIEILKKGGNAIDAVVSIAFAMAVSYPSCGNIGGDGFMQYHGSDGTKTSFNFRSRAPLAATPDMFLDNNGKTSILSEPEGILTVAVPGTVAGMQLAHTKFGKLPWYELIAPAIKLAEEGFIITQRLYSEMKYSEKELRKYPSSTKIFLKNNELPRLGDLFVQEDLADTLKRIQLNGADDLYRGVTAKKIVKFMEDNDGLITSEDLESYTVIESEPLHGDYRCYDVYTIGPPSSGITLLEMLNVLEGYDLQKIGHNSSEYLHILTEIMNLTQLDRVKYVCDPEFNRAIPLGKLTSKEYASVFRNKIGSLKALNAKYDEIGLVKEKKETTHYSVVDNEGNAVSVTYSLNGDFGSCIVAEGTGIMLNNNMTDFDKATLNTIEPGKRPRSSMIPTIIAKENKPLLVLGSPGGAVIPNVVMQIAINFIDFGMSLEKAVSVGRISHGWLPNTILAEKESVAEAELVKYKKMNYKVYDENVAMQYNVPYKDPSLGTAMCIHIDQANNVYWGVADPRSGDPSAIGLL